MIGAQLRHLERDVNQCKGSQLVWVAGSQMFEKTT